jgi:hydrogenase expression/formation protein HypE
MKISLGHGSGGKLTHDLIKNLFLKKLDNPILAELTDAAIIELDKKRFAFTTDSYVVKPLFFPGGDIGRLAIFGTVNDLAVMGAKPLFISCGLIIEEGFDYASLEKVIDSIEEAKEIAGIEVITGDTKVVEKGGADGLFVNTSGIGEILDGVKLSVRNIKVGDKIILNGPIADHGISILSSREGFEFESEITSDCAPLNELILKILAASDGVRFMRDPTRGGLATTLNEIVEGTNFGILIDEEKVPLREPVRAACELLGLDPFYIGNEGKVAVVIDRKEAESICGLMREHPLGKESQIIGEITEGPKGKVCLKTATGGTRVLDMLIADQLPRIC